MKVKLRFITNRGKQCTSARLLKALLSALWDESDRQDVIATVHDFVRLVNDNRVFFYPFPLDLYRARLLDNYVGGYQHFPWDMLDDVHSAHIGLMLILRDLYGRTETGSAVLSLLLGFREKEAQKITIGGREKTHGNKHSPNRQSRARQDSTPAIFPGARS